MSSMHAVRPAGGADGNARRGRQKRVGRERGGRLGEMRVVDVISIALMVKAMRKS
jgi:hypothetical protein